MTDADSSTETATSQPLSKTAIWVAAARAIGAREPDMQVRNPDTFAERLLGDPAQLILRHPIVDALDLDYAEAMQDLEVADTVRAMTVRTRFIDAALERAINAGATQVLIPGAGLDSHAYRCRELLAAATVFEVDRPATVEFKQQRVADALGEVPDNLTWVAADFARETLADALARHGYDTSKRTFVIMEGVTMYVPEAALRGTFAFIAGHPHGSSVVFDIATQAMIDNLQRVDVTMLPPAARPSMERFLDIISDEPWLFGIAVDAEAAFLGDFGLRIRDMLTVGGEESVARYLTRADGTTVGAEAHAKAEALREAAQAQMSAQMSPEQLERFSAQMREMRRQSAYRIVEAVVD